jgi:hypothetical protein
MNYAWARETGVTAHGQATSATPALVWSVKTQGGWCNATSSRTHLGPGAPIRIKATYNSSAGSGAKLFINGVLDGHDACTGGGGRGPYCHFPRSFSAPTILNLVVSGFSA